MDGIEAKIIAGAGRLLRSEKLKTILIELNVSLEGDLALIDCIKSNGFNLVSEYSHEHVHSDYSMMKNFIFSREELKLKF